MEIIVNLCGLGSLRGGDVHLTKGSDCNALICRGKIPSTSNEETTMNFQDLRKIAVAMTLAVVMVAGCKSKEDAAIDKAKLQAAATGQAQQVVSTDKNGNVTTTTVQPPAPGQTTQAVTTTVTPAAGVPANTPAAAPVAAGQPVTAGEPGGSGEPGAAPAPGVRPVA